jgi:tungstate transport system ATP-binding protein
MRIAGVCFEVAGRRLLDRIDLMLGGGRLSVIMGPNGAGKSLLLRLMHGLLTPTAGDILWNGAPPGTGVRRRQALAVQRPVLLRRSAAANLDYVLGRSRRAAARRDALLERVGLQSLARQPARTLSGGEQQRLALARALALDPEVLLLDEPTASLDPASVAIIESIVLAAQRDGTKVVFVTHDVAQARRIADEVVFLHRGRVEEHTTAPEFFEAPASRAARDYLAGRIVL